MARILLNSNKEIKGMLTASRKKDVRGNIVISGQLLTHRYIEHIYRIETERFVFNDVEVYGEEFASNDAMIRYEFFAESMRVKGFDKENNESNLPKEIINIVEKDLFKEEENELIHEEVYRTWISESKR